MILAAICIFVVVTRITYACSYALGQLPCAPVAVDHMPAPRPYPTGSGSA